MKFIYDKVLDVKTAIGENVLFDIFLVDSEKEKEGAPNFHRHSFHELIYVEKGEGKHFIDKSEFTITPNSIFVISKGQFHTFQEGGWMRGVVIRFKDGFIPKWGYENWNYRLTLFNHSFMNMKIYFGNDISFKQLYLDQMLEEYKKTRVFGQKEVMSYYLNIILIKIEQQKIKNKLLNHLGDTSNNVLIHRFITFLEYNYKKYHSTEQYCSNLQIDKRKLDQLLVAAFGFTTKKIIENRLISEAVRYLEFTGLPIKEIAFELGFKSPYQFSNFFKNIKQFSPREYRINNS